MPRARVARTLGLAVMAVTGLLSCGAVLADTDRQTRLQPVEGRQTVLRPTGTGGGLGEKPLDTVFRQAEIPSGKLEETRRLLRELQARETPQRDIVIDLPADVLFDFDKSSLRPDAMPALDRAARLLASYPQAPVLIHGHTDSKGSDAYNDALSLRRAEAVSAHLRQLQATRNFSVAGFGERRPVAPNALPDGSDDPAGRQRNRRVEIVIRAASGGAAPQLTGSSAPSERATSLSATSSTP